MTASINPTSDCCDPTCSTLAINTPGPKGDTGAAGSNGANGVNGNNGYSATSENFNIPAADATINLYVTNATIWSAGMYAFIEGSGHYKVNGRGSAYINITRLNYPTDPGSTGATIPAGALIIPAGSRGDAGASGSVDLLTSKGQLLVRTSSAQTTLAAGTGSYQALYTNSAAAAGVEWRRPAFTDFTDQLALDSQVKNKLPLSSVGNSGGSNGDICYWNGSAWVRLAASEGKYLKIVSGVPVYTDAPGITYLAKGIITINGAAASSAITGSSAANVFNIPSVNPVSGDLNGSAVLSFDSSISTATPIVVVTPVFVSGALTPKTIQIVSTSASQIELDLNESTVNSTVSFHIAVFA